MILTKKKMYPKTDMLNISNITKMQASAIRINDVFAVEPSVSDKDNKPVATDGNAPCVEFRNCLDRKSTRLNSSHPK